MPYDVISIGSILQDVFLVHGDFNIVSLDKFASRQGICLELGSKNEFQEMYFDTGGSATSAAVTFANLKLSTALVTKVGDDEVGKKLVKDVKKKKINTDFIVTTQGEQTGYAIVIISQDGERTALVYRGASGKFRASDIPLSKLKSKWLYITSFGGDTGLMEKVITSAKKKGVKIALNPGRLELEMGFKKLLPILRQVDILLLNKKEAALLTGHRERDIREMFAGVCIGTPGIVVITDGARGAYACPGVEEENYILFADSLPAKAINTTGAGDAFGSGFVAGIILRDSLEYALRLGTLNAHSAVQQMGAQHGLLARVPSQTRLNQVKVRKL